MKCWTQNNQVDHIPLDDGLQILSSLSSCECRFKMNQLALIRGWNDLSPFDIHFILMIFCEFGHTQTGSSPFMACWRDGLRSLVWSRHLDGMFVWIRGWVQQTSKLWCYSRIKPTTGCCFFLFFLALIPRRKFCLNLISCLEMQPNEEVFNNFFCSKIRKFKKRDLKNITYNIKTLVKFFRNLYMGNGTLRGFGLGLIQASVFVIPPGLWFPLLNLWTGCNHGRWAKGYMHTNMRL